MGIKQTLKEFLSRNRLFLGIRYSRVFLRIWLWRRPAVLDELDAQARYYELLLSDLLPGPHRAFDIGAHEGFVSAVLLKKGLQVTALDPDPRNARILRARYHKNERFQFFPFAAGEKSGLLTLYRQSSGTALSTLEPRWRELLEKPGHRLHTRYEEGTELVRVIPLDELIGNEKPPCLIKIDAEGYERHVLRGLSIRVPLLTFEANLPEFLPETLECLERLFHLDPEARYNYVCDFRYGLGVFTDYISFCTELSAVQYPCIDIVCRMSNYSIYYKVAQPPEA